MNLLLLTPPLVQLNAPYPATTQLKAYIDSCSCVKCEQRDMSIDLVSEIFTRSFIESLFVSAFQSEKLTERAKSVAANKDRYIDTLEPVISFLRGEDSTLAPRIATGDFLPRAGRFRKVDDEDMEWAFGTTGIIDRARHYASLYLVDIADFICDTTGGNFALIRYGEQLALSAPIFDYLKRAVGKESSVVDDKMFDILERYVRDINPDVIGFSIPFPGTLYAALKCAKYLKTRYPHIKIVFGGGYVNTELRTMTDIQIFEYIDYLLFDDGELPLSTLLSYLNGDIGMNEVVRCKYLLDGAVADSGDWDSNIPFGDLPAPTYNGLPMNRYISIIELTNPMHKLWSDGKWNKLTVAHGCYWAKCAFCDTSLDYISRYDAPTACVVVDRMESIIKETGVRGFHFTDEALPPKLLKEVANEILARGLIVSYWGNIRFEKSFNREMCELLARSGCIAVSGGLEVASNRILKAINKGVTIETATEVAHYMTSSGIMVHAYLMYGFPTQTMQESIDSLDIVRQMFEEGLLQSAFWHRYTMTIHSPSGCNPEKYGALRDSYTLNSFANNGVKHSVDGDTIDYRRLGDVLYKATYNYMHGNGYDIPLKNWFESKSAVPRVAHNYISKILDRLD